MSTSLLRAQLNAHLKDVHKLDAQKIFASNDQQLAGYITDESKTLGPESVLLQLRAILSDDRAIENFGHWKLKQKWKIATTTIFGEHYSLDEFFSKSGTILYRDAKNLLDFESTLSRIYNEDDGKKYDDRHFVEVGMGIVSDLSRPYKMIKDNANFDADPSEVDRWVSEVLVVQVKKATMDLQAGKIRPQVALGIAEGLVLAIDQVNKVMGSSFDQDRFIARGLDMIGTIRGKPVSDATTQGLLNLKVPQYIVWEAKLNGEFGKLDRSNKAAVSKFFDKVFADANADESGEMNLKKLKQADTWFFTCFYPNFVSNRPEITEVPGLVTAEFGRGTISAQTNEAFHKLIEAAVYYASQRR